MDLQEIRSVNKQWIFYTDDTHTKSNRDELENINQTARNEFRFYDRMYSELAELIDREREKLKARHCPTLEEIDAVHSVCDSIELKIKRDYYIADNNKISGIYDALSYAHMRREHARKLEMQSRKALEG